MSLPRKQPCWAISNISNGEQWSVRSTALASFPGGGGNRLAFVRSVFRISLAVAVAVIFVADRGRLRIQFGQLCRCARDIFESIPLFSYRTCMPVFESITACRRPGNRFEIRQTSVIPIAK